MTTFRPPIDARRMRGFSLIEMIAAFLVFAIGIAVMMQILTASIRNARMSSDYTMAALWAQSKLDTVGVGERLEEGRSSGRFDDSYGWELDIHQVDPAAVEPPPQQPAAVPGSVGANGSTVQQMGASSAGLGGGLQATPFDLYQVDLTVFWGGRHGAQPRTAQFSTLRAMNPDPNNPLDATRGGAGPNMPQQARMRTGGGRQ